MCLYACCFGVFLCIICVCGGGVYVSMLSWQAVERQVHASTHASIKGGGDQTNPTPLFPTHTHRDENVVVGGLPPDGIVRERPDSRGDGEGQDQRLEEEAAGLFLVLELGEKRGGGMMNVKRGPAVLFVCQRQRLRPFVCMCVHFFLYFLGAFFFTSGKTRRSGGYTTRSA